MKLNFKLKRVLSIMLAIIMIFGVIDLSFVGTVFANPIEENDWSESEKDYFVNKIVQVGNFSSEEMEVVIENKIIDEILKVKNLVYDTITSNVEEFPTWDNNVDNLDEFVAEGQLYSQNGKVVDFQNDYKYVPEYILNEISTELTGAFYSTIDGEIYYAVDGNEEFDVNEDLFSAVEIETIDDIKFFMGKSKDTNLGELNTEDIGKKILIQYNGDNPLEILNRKDIIAIAESALDLEEYASTTNSSITADLNNIKYIGSSALGMPSSREAIYKTINIENLIYIGEFALAGVGLKGSLSLDKTIYIDNYALAGNKIRYLTLGEELTYIGTNAFLENQLIDLQITGNPVIRSGAFNSNGLMNEDAFIMYNGELVSYAGIQRSEIKVPDGISKMNLRAFSDTWVSELDISNIEEIYIESDEFKEPLDVSNLEEITIGQNIDLFIVNRAGDKSIYDENNFSINNNLSFNIYEFFDVYDGNSRSAGTYYYNGDEWSLSGGPGEPQEPGDELDNFVITPEGKITSYTGNSVNLVIPTEINGIEVKDLGRMFNNNLPETIEVLGNINEVNMGISYSTINKIIFHGSVNTIKSRSFDDVEIVEFRGTVGRVESNAFDNIRELTFLGNVTTLNSQFFVSNYYFRKITIGENVTLPRFDYNDYSNRRMYKFVYKYGTSPEKGVYQYYDSYNVNVDDWIHFKEENVDFAGGNGTKDNPYLIENTEQFKSALDSQGDFHFKQMANLDFTDYQFGVNDIKFIDKVYDGNNFAIENINQTDTANYSMSLFGIVDNSEIINLDINNVNIDISNINNDKDYNDDYGIIADVIEDSFLGNIGFSNITLNLNNKKVNNIGLIAGSSKYSSTEKIDIKNVNVDIKSNDGLNFGSLYGFSEGRTGMEPSMMTLDSDFERDYNLPQYIGNVNVQELNANLILGDDDFTILIHDGLVGVGGLVGVSTGMLYTDIKMDKSEINTDGSILFSVGGVIGGANHVKISNVDNNMDINASAVAVGGLVGSSLNMRMIGSGDMMRSLSIVDDIIDLDSGSSNYSNIVIKGNIINNANYYPIHYFAEQFGNEAGYNDLTNKEISKRFFSGTGGLLGIAINTNVNDVVVNLDNLEGPVNVGGVIGAAHNIEIEDLEIITDINITEGKDKLPRINTGGFVGFGEYITAVGIDYIGTVYGKNNSGGLAGELINSLISKTDITATVKGLNNVGGISGQAKNTNINKTDSLIMVNGINNVGGIIGDSIDNKVYRANLFQSTINGGNVTGGLIGNSSSDTIMESKMSNTEVNSVNLETGNFVGKLTGITKIINSYIKDIKANENLVGQVDNEDSTLEVNNIYVSNEKGKNTIYKNLEDNLDLPYENMKEQVNYINTEFNFPDMWKQDATKNNKLPFLWWEYPNNNQEIGDAFLSSLEVSEGELSPEFNKDNNYYEVKLSEHKDTIKISAKGEDNGKITLNGETFNNDKIIDLVSGNNIVSMKVTSIDGIKTNIYTVNIINNKSATLLDLEIEDVKITPEFEPNHTEYEATVDKKTSSVTIKTETSSDNNIYINGEITNDTSTTINNLLPGINIVTIKVVSKDNERQTVYVIKIVKEEIRNDVMITYFPNNIEWGNTSNKVEYITNLSIEGSTATAKEGYLFKHWENLNGDIVSTNRVIVPQKVAEAYVAVFVPKEYEVKFLGRNGDMINTQTIKHKGSAIAPTPPTEDGMVFLGWSSKAYLDVTSDLEIQAIYKEQGKFVVTYNSNGADEDSYPQMQQVLEGNNGVNILPEPPIKMGYKFTEWNTHSDGAGATFTSITPVDKDIEVFAQYVPFFINIEANPNIIVADGKSTSTITVILKDENAIPIRNALVEIEAEYGSFPEGSATVTDSYGTAKIRFKSEEIKSTSRTNVKVIAKVTDKANGLYGTAEISMIFEPSHISGVVLDRNNNPIQGATVIVDEPEINFYAETKTSPLGKYSIPVAEGNRIYNIKVIKPIIVNNIDVDVAFDQKASVGDIAGDKLQIVSPDKTLTGVIKIKDENKKDVLTGEFNGIPINIKQRTDGVLTSVGEVNKETGIFKINNVAKNKEYFMTITTDDNKEVIIGKFLANISDGQLKIQEELIDPYGTIRNSLTKNIVGNAEVKLFYANTARNIAKGNTPDTLVKLPVINGFLPSDNNNPQMSTSVLVFNNDVNVMDHGNYAWMVFPEADYYITGTHKDYFDYDSRKSENGIISVDWDIIKYDFEMKPLKSDENLNPDEVVVTFVDWDNSTIKKEIIKVGANATSPSNPIRKGYIFTGWDKSFTNVQKDLTVKALYKEDTSKPVTPPVTPPGGGSSGDSSGGSSNTSDDRDYKIVKGKLDNLIPYTILKDTKIDINKITGISKKDLSYVLDTSVVGVTTLKAKLMGRHLEYKLEVVDLVKNTLIFIEKPNHWAMDYARYAIDKGFIIGYTDGSIGLDRILTYSESFTALDRLLLKNNLVELNLSRTIIEDNTNIPENKWYHYTVKSILSKYVDKNKIVEIDYNQPISREEIAQILYNSFNGKFKENKMLANYVDEVEISNKTAVQFAYNTGLMIGMPDGKFAPKKTLTRAEFMTILTRLDQMLSENAVE